MLAKECLNIIPQVLKHLQTLTCTLQVLCHSHYLFLLGLLKNLIEEYIRSERSFLFFNMNP